METGRRVVLVSEGAEPLIRIPSQSGLPVSVERDVMEKALSLVQKRETGPVFLLFFLTAEEVSLVDSFFSSFRVHDVSYGIVACSPALKGRDPALLSAAVVCVRNSRITEQEFAFLVEGAFVRIKDKSTLKAHQEDRMVTLLDIQRDLEELINIGKALSLEKDSEKLLRSILYLSKKITGADAGSIFLVEENGDGVEKLRFRYSHTFSKELAYETFAIPIDVHSIAGYVATTGTILNIPDVYELGQEAPYAFNRSFDQEHGYRTKSMLTVPMRNHLDEIIGVIQLINSKETKDSDRVFSGNEAFEIRLETAGDFENRVVAFDHRYESLMEAVASQAAIAIENNRMLRQIESQFDEFVKASVSAIESRDPATSGHSLRVAEISVAVARAITEQQDGPFKDAFFSASELKELELAGLLHDFGKVYLDPNVFLKGNKLYPKDLLYLHMRLNFLYRSVELSYAERANRRLLSGRDGGRRAAGKKLDELVREKSEKLSNLLQIIDLVDVLNRPNIRSGEPEDMIRDLEVLGGDLAYTDLKGEPIPLLTGYERENFSIKRGSLNREERLLIESHVEHSYNFVSRIPWPPEYRRIPEIIRGHHEKLDGSGYPNGWKGREQILLPARIMAMADIFDALTAPDRPYKKSVPLEKVLHILQEEAGANKLDGDVVDLFIDKELYRRFLERSSAQRSM